MSGAEERAPTNRSSECLLRDCCNCISASRILRRLRLCRVSLGVCAYGELGLRRGMHDSSTYMYLGMGAE